MSIFELAIPIVLRHEGGLVDNPNDPGGITNHGVSLRWLKSKGLAGDLNHDGDVDAEDIKIMTADQAAQFYKTYWWDKYNYGAIIAQVTANKIFDTAVNMGPFRPAIFAQRIVGIEPTTGNIGPRTLAAVNAMPSTQFISAFQNMQAQFYRDLVAANPRRAEFLNGWLARAYDQV